MGRKTGTQERRDDNHNLLKRSNSDPNDGVARFAPLFSQSSPRRQLPQLPHPLPTLAKTLKFILISLPPRLPRLPHTQTTTPGPRIHPIHDLPTRRIPNSLRPQHALLLSRLLLPPPPLLRRSPIKLNFVSFGEVVSSTQCVVVV
jgi:hypothetical protein